jgi:hypothetical protein
MRLMRILSDPMPLPLPRRAIADAVAAACHARRLMLSAATRHFHAEFVFRPRAPSATSPASPRCAHASA